MKKIAVVLTIFILLGSLFGCVPSAPTNEGKSIVCTQFSLYDFAKNILGENPGDIRLTYLLEKGVDMHSYQPTAEDFITIKESDLFLYIGGESELWAETVETKGKSFSLMHAVTPECTLPDHEHGELMVDHVVDEHIWLSPQNASTMVNAIYKEIVAIDPENEAVYQKNAEAYLGKLNALHEEYQTLKDADGTLLFADRFPFIFLTADYEIECFAAFTGCSAETEASFETVVFLTEILKEKNLPAILVLENSDTALAETIRREAGSDAEILVLNSIQSVTGEKVEGGATYLSYMEENLQVLRKALK